MIQLAVLITCHNRKEKTINCLKLLFDQKIGKDFQIHIFLVDDGSTDGTTEAVNLQFPKVNIIKGDGNLFWNRGMNLAWKEAAKTNPDYYLWLNDDTFLFENCLDSLLESSNEKKNKAIIVGTTISENTKLISYGGRNENGRLIEPNKNLQECHHFNGNVVLVPKSVFEKVGILDPIFHHAMGDFDYGMRAKKKGIKIFLASEILGCCETHGVFAKWCQVETPFRERIKILYKSSCDSNPYQQFVFEKRHFGTLKASFHWLTIHIRVAFPAIWRLKLSE